MAMNVKFLRGVIANYNSLAEKNADTLYFCTDGALYLGANKIANWTDLTDVNAAIKTLQDAGYQNASQVGAAITEALKPYAKTADIQGALDKANSALQAADLADYAKTADVVAKTVYETHLTTQSEKDAAQDAEIAKKYVKPETGIAKTDLAADVQTSLGLADSALQTHQDISHLATTEYVNQELAKKQNTILENTYDAYGAAATAEQNAKDYSDGKLNAVVEQYLTGEGAADTIDTLNEIADWINNDTAGVSQIIKDVAANTQAIADEKAAREGADNTINGEIDAIQNQLNGIAAGDGTVKAAIDAVDGKFADYTKTADLGDLATKDSLTAGEVGAYTKEEVNTALEPYAKTADIEDSLALADTAVQPEAIADMATKTEIAKDYATKAELDLVDVKVTFPGADGNLPVLTDAVGTNNGSPIFRDSGVSLDDLAKQADFDEYVEDHKDDYTNAQIDAAIKVASDAAAAADAKAVAAQGEVDALEGVVAQNAQTCQNNFNSIVAQLTWGEF